MKYKNKRLAVKSDLQDMMKGDLIEIIFESDIYDDLEYKEENELNYLSYDQLVDIIVESKKAWIYED